MFGWMEWNRMGMRIEMVMVMGMEWNGHSIPSFRLVQQNNVGMELKKVINDNNALIINNSKILFENNLKNVQLFNKIKIF